jgi:membrane associated rhomboid family serine protease
MITKQAESMSDVIPGISRGAVPKAVPSIQGAWLVGLLAAVLVLLWFTGESGRELLRYERAAVLQVQYWRLLTGHFVHGSGQHLLLNAVGLGLVAALFPREYSLRGWLLILASSIVTIDL